MRINKQSSRGFTIIELLVVIVIIAVITALTMAIYTGIQSKVIDLSVTSDSDRLNSLEMNYKSNHGSAGKAYYSGNGPDSELGNFVPKNGNIFDVAVNATDYCIRGYNVHGTKDSISNATLKESTVGKCDIIPPSAAAAATPSVPSTPVITVAMVGGAIQATITPVTCSVGTPRYIINSRLNDGNWEGYSAWSESTTATRTADDGTKYGYQAQAQCYISYIPIASAPSQGVEGTYSNLLAPSGPTVAVVINGGNIDATVAPITCVSGTIQYGFSSRINSDTWSAYSAWSSSTTSSIAASGGEGAKYGFIAQSRCYTSVNAVSTTSVGTENSYTSPINTPAVPVLSTATTPGYQTTYSWLAVSCAAGTTARYQYKLSISPSGYNSVWTGIPGLSAVFSTSTGDQTYTVQTQSQCFNANTSSNWSVSGTASYVCVYDSVPIATSISGAWATAPTGYILEDGTAISRTTYSDLFAAIGTTYGVGDGSTTFNLPDSRGRVAVNLNSNDGEFNTMGEKFGEKAHTLTGAESGLIGHNHIQDAHNHSKTYNFAGSFPGGQDRPLYYGTNGASLSTVWYDNTTATNQAAPASNASSAHNTIQPSITKLFAVKYRPATGANSMLSAATSISGYFTSAPSGYLVEDGSAVSRTAYSDLFATIGTTYGAGDGSTTFNLPDSRGRVAVNINPSDAEFATIGQKYGEKYHLDTITESGLKGHNHLQDPHSHSRVYNFTNSFPGGQDRPLYYGTNGASLATVYTDSTTATNQAVASSNASSAHNTIQPSIVKIFAIKYTPAGGSTDSLNKGTSITGYWATAPSGYLLEDGSIVSRATYSDLFAVISTTYGVGDGSTTFNLPDSRGRVMVNKNPSDTEFDVLGEISGEKTHLLTGAESGEKGHNHIQDAHSHSKVYNFSGSFPGGQDRPLYYGTNGASLSTVWTDNTTATNQAVASVNAISSHNNIQPSIVQNFAIRY